MKNHLSCYLRKHEGLLKFLVLCILLTSSALRVKAQQTNQVTSGGTWYLEYLPADYNSNTNKYPVIFFLHGLGERGDNEASLANVAKNGPPKYTKGGQKFPFILISPQLKSKYTGWPNSYIDAVIEFVRSNPKYRIDESRMYLTGLSLGGGGTWGYIQDPVLGAKIAASVICCGHQNNTGKACNIVNNGIPIWGFHGDADGTVSVNKTINMIKAINLCDPAPNPKALITIYPGVGHNCWDKAYEPKSPLPDASQCPLNVYDWMLQFKNGGLVVNAGTDLTVNLPLNTGTLNGSATVGSGSITSYLWTKQSGPTVTLSNETASSVSLADLKAGVYTFRLTVTTSNAETAFDDVKVTVVAPTNQAPVANAGVDKTITLPLNAVTINGTGSDTDGTVTGYAWTKVSGPAVSGLTTTPALPLTGLTAGTYVFQLTVTDNLGATGSDQVTVTVNPAAVNQSPTANAGTDKTVNFPPTNTLNITGSGADVDGTIKTYLWTKVSGPTVTITNGSLSTVSLSALVVGVYVFQLTVTDDKGATGSDQVQVTVIDANQSPVANAGIDLSITLPTSSTNINGSGSDADGSVTGYAWSFVSGPISPALPAITNAPTLSVTGLINAGTYVYRLTVTDNLGSTGFDDVKVLVNPPAANIPPTANAGPDQSITLPINTVTLNGSGSDPDGTVTFNWTKISGPAITLPPITTTLTLIVDNLITGTYVFRLTAKDNQNATKTDDVQVTVQPAVVNQIPTVNTGTDIFKTLPDNTVTITATANDADGSVTGFLWTKVSGPAILPTDFLNSTTTSLTVNSLVAGVYTFQLTVTDDKGATNSDAINVSVSAANVPPVANAGSDITITSPASTTMINGSGTDADGTVASYAWSQISALPYTPGATNTQSFSVADLQIGTYTFRLTVTDDKGDTGFDDVKVIVNAPANQTPTADAGSDASITLPINSTNITGFGTDPDGIISTYSWSIISKPPLSTVTDVANLTNAASNTVTISVDVAGDYVLHFVVTDNGGASDFDDVTLTVKPAANNAPTADAGANQSTTLPIDAMDLTGTGSDPDLGNTITYAWTKQSGPTVDINNADQPTVALSKLLEGTYVFRLTVTDNLGSSGYDEVTVTVLPATVNQPPTVNAGTDQSTTLASTTLTGTGSDPDGGIVTYLWEYVSNPGGANQPVPTNTASTFIDGLTTNPAPYVLRLTVTDDKGATATDDVSITVTATPVNQPPTANAGTDKTISLPTSSVNLAGSGSDPDVGNVLTYSWVKVSGPAATLGTLTNPTLSVSGLVKGVYVFRLEVSDGSLTNTDDVKVTVLPANVNKAPIVVTDADISIYLPTNIVNISGTVSDLDGSIISQVWTQVSGPTVAAADFLNPTTTNLTVNNLVIGIYTFRLTATDNANATGSDVTKVTVFADTVNQPPIAKAGDDQATTKDNVKLDGSGSSDPDGTVVSYFWSKVSGPICTFTPNSSSPTLDVTAMADGTYQFALFVKDNKGKSSPQDVVQIVVSPGINNPPTIKPLADVSVQLPDNSTTLDGTASDVDGTTPIVHWESISGPSTIPGDPKNLADPLSLTNLIEGEYVFKFVAVDAVDPNLLATDQMTVTVFAPPAINTPPTVDAGDPQSITLPDNSAKLVAIAKSDDGLIESYKWTLVSSPPQATFTLSNDTTVAFLDISGITIEGSYKFSVTVTDNDGLEASDETTLVVEAGPYNVFTPNNDNILETWHIGTVSNFDGCEISVYNRQGLRVYKSIGYDQEWNGTYNGQPLPEGVYFYTIGCPSIKAKTGTVTIIR